MTRYDFLMTVKADDIIMCPPIDSYHTTVIFKVIANSITHCSLRYHYHVAPAARHNTTAHQWNWGNQTNIDNNWRVITNEELVAYILEN